MKHIRTKQNLKIDEIITYSTLVSVENANLQKGMNFGINKNYSVFLMSVRKNAPYNDIWDKESNTIIYEGHDLPNNLTENPKTTDQPLCTKKGSLTENGKFFAVAQAYKLGYLNEPHKIKVYEKLQNGVWCHKGFFNLINAIFINEGGRKVFKYFLQPIEFKSFNREIIIPHTRVIPTEIKVEVWARDKGKCIFCGSNKNLHFDHDVPYSKGGASLTSRNVRILCMKCNLQKSNKIFSIPPFIIP